VHRLWAIRSPQRRCEARWLTRTQSGAGERERKSDAKQQRSSNRRNEHTEGGTTTKDSALDIGVPMLPGSSDEPVGPEDALGAGPKRGDYRDVQDGSQHFRSVPNPKGGEPIRDGDGNIVDRESLFTQEHQNPHLDDIGDESGQKGGVDTAA
jgi:hypothetical protein